MKDTVEGRTQSGENVPIGDLVPSLIPSLIWKGTSSSEPWFQPPAQQDGPPALEPEASSSCRVRDAEVWGAP